MKCLRICLAAILLSAVIPSAAVQTTPALAFRIDEGDIINSFLRDGRVAAHLLLRSGEEPRLLVAFPAGNSGVGLWFDKTTAPVTWTIDTPPHPITAADDQRRPLHGIEFEITAAAPELRYLGTVLSSIRVLRDYELLKTAPAEVLVPPRISSGRITWARDRLDGAAGYRLTIEALGGTRVSTDRFIPAPGAPVRLRVQALTGETPLEPLDELLTPEAGNDARSRNALAFLSYRDKFLAGSWRFDTYFGRDTLISAMLLAPVLEPAAIEAAITSVLDRLAPNGEVAHEEDIGEFAVLRNQLEGRGRIATPVYDYGMVDDDFPLAPLAARWLLDDARGQARARVLLARRSAGGETYGVALVRNLSWVVERSAPFANSPRATNLVGIKPGRNTGQWRDSEKGLGLGRYAYDVNAALIPAALVAAARISDSGLLDEYDKGQGRTLARARAQARVWSARAAPLFSVTIPASRARPAITAYAAEAGVDADQALGVLGKKPLAFHALSLDAEGRPIPILNSDEGFRLLLTDPGPEDLERCIDTIMRPFPVGLVTDAGLLVANPAHAGAELRREFTRFAYHGTVVWSWQQALMIAGLDRQLRRADLPARLRAKLSLARALLWEVIDRSKSLRTSELWSWSFADGQYRIEPFGQRGADADESNAAQLWSTVFLGLTTGTSPGN
jgi:hypothetical protein